MNSLNTSNENDTITLTEDSIKDTTETPLENTLESTPEGTLEDTDNKTLNISSTDINGKAKSLVPEDDEYSIHEKIERIFKETEEDRKSQIAKRIKYGDAFTQAALSIAFWGFWIFWLIVFLM